MLTSLPGILGNLIAALVCFGAMAFGGREERFVGALLLVSQFASVVVQSRSDWAGPQFIILMIDVALLLPAFGLALFSSRAWTIGFAAYQALTVVTHLAIQFEPDGGRARTWAYITGLVVWGYLIWVCLAWGTWTAWRDRERPDRGRPRRNQDASSGRNAQRQV